MHNSVPEIREACADSILGHAATLEADIETARVQRNIDGHWTAMGFRTPETPKTGAFNL
ncbi:hypothetical protein [Gymnodinialimonas sp. 57CJ19]|uniref:hypothetical protein n=1 Tax=Gymnodinialimonas sp. 57CJ19 TaxID=3138498 RepID=UPI0031345046